MFNNANEVKINGKTVQSIKTMGGNLYMKPNTLPTLILQGRFRVKPHLERDDEIFEPTSSSLDGTIFINPSFNVPYGQYTIFETNEIGTVNFTTDGQVWTYRPKLPE